MNGKLGMALIAASLILGAAVLAGSLLVKSSLDRGTAELTGVRSALGEFKTALVAAAQPAQPPARPRGPDPDRRYTVNTQGSAKRGPDTAKVKLVAFSDFQ